MPLVVAGTVPDEESLEVSVDEDEPVEEAGAVTVPVEPDPVVLVVSVLLVVPELPAPVAELPVADGAVGGVVVLVVPVVVLPPAAVELVAELPDPV